MENPATRIERGAWVIIEGERNYRLSEAEGYNITTDQWSRKLMERLTR
jgi:hypothetical protein